MQRADFKKTDDMFNRVLGRDHIAVICLLEHRETGTRFVLGNVHIEWAPEFRDVKLVQVALLVEELEKIRDEFARLPPRPPGPSSDGVTRPPAPIYTDGSKIPVVLCSDLNSIPSSGVYELLAGGSVGPDHQDWMDHTYGRYTSDGLRHRLGFKSAYAHIGELRMTNYTPSFKGPIDYIWYSTQNLAVTAVLGDVDKGYLEKVAGFPNAHFPSE
jgi:CCR4-NOT transcription complex subunit 6